MATDIQLDAEDGSFVVIESRALKSTASDFILDAPARRGANERGIRGVRRALVHNQRDGLTINFNRDYPGGVTINDVVELNNRVGGIRLSDVVEISPYAPAHMVAGASPKGLVLRGDIRIQRDPGEDVFDGARTSDATPGSEAAARTDDTVSLQELLTELQREVAHLRERVAQLEYPVSAVSD